MDLNLIISHLTLSVLVTTTFFLTVYKLRTENTNIKVFTFLLCVTMFTLMIERMSGILSYIIG